MIRTVALTKRYPGPPAGPPGGWGGGPSRAAGSNGAAAVAVDQLDLEVRGGEIFGLLGPNGAGKTTTIGMLTTRVIPTAGEAWVAGIDVVAEPARAKQLIGVVTQTNTLDRSLTVYENLFFHGRYFGMSGHDAKAEANRLLEQFRLGEKAKTDVNALSGGMAQRLMVARSIMHKPAVLFLDEPTAGLDPQSRLSLWATVQELNALGQTILLTTHYMEEADQLCGRVAIMDHGKILALDTPSGLKRSVDADTVVTVAADRDSAQLASVFGALDGVTKTDPIPEGVVVHVRGGRGILPRILQAAEAAGIEVNDLSVAEPTLETVFISLTGKELRD
ncbi:MAG: type transport system ATP-binding protein [Acidimicrobiaceae bacterium]